MSEAKKFTDAWLRKLKPATQGGRDQYLDASCPGLILRVCDRGIRRFLVRFTVRGQGQKMMSLGVYPEVSLSSAREKAMEAQRKGAEGIDEKAERETELAGRIAEAERTFATLFGGDERPRMRRKRDARGKLVKHVRERRQDDQGRWRYRYDYDWVEDGTVVEADPDKWENEFWCFKRDKMRRAEGVRELRNHFRRTFLTTPWGERALAHMEPADFYDWMDWARDEGNGEVSIRKTAGVLRDMYKWSIRKRLYRGVPPTVKDVWEVGIKSGTRTRYLLPDELRAVWAATFTLEAPHGEFYRFCLLTGQRLMQCVHTRWADVDLDDGVWQARADDTKSGEEKLVPLSRQAVSLLRGLSGEGEYVFGGETPFVTHKVKHNKLYKAAGRVKDDPSHPDGGWTPHDFRRTQRTRLARVSGVKSHVADMLAGRRGNEQQGVSGIYNQHDYLEEMRHAAQAWADWLEVVVNDDETVVPMEAAQ